MSTAERPAPTSARRQWPPVAARAAEGRGRDAAGAPRWSWSRSPARPRWPASSRASCCSAALASSTGCTRARRHDRAVVAEPPSSSDSSARPDVGRRRTSPRELRRVPSRRVLTLRGSHHDLPCRSPTSAVPATSPTPVRARRHPVAISSPRRQILALTDAAVTARCTSSRCSTPSAPPAAVLVAMPDGRMALPIARCAAAEVGGQRWPTLPGRAGDAGGRVTGRSPR